MGRLEEKMSQTKNEKKEAEENKSLLNRRSIDSPTILDIAKDNSLKSERMSLRVYPEIKEQFHKINRARGLSNNSALNMIMTDYVEKFQYLLEK